MDGPPDDFGMLTITERALDPGARFDSWRQMLSRKLLEVGGDSLGYEPYWANAKLRILPGLRTGTGSFAASRFVRTKQIVAASDDDFVLVVNLKGKFSAEQRGRERSLDEGDAYLMACSEPGSFIRRTDGELSCVRVPARALAPRVPGRYDRVAHRIPRQCEILNLVLAYIRTTDQLSLSDSQLRGTAVSHVYDLVTLTLNPSRDNICESEDAGLRSGRLSAIKAYVDRNLGRHSLSVRDVGERFGLSPRQVQRLFESEGQTFSRYVLYRRLDKVRGALMDRRFRERNIGDIALESGFGDQSSVTRAFRAHFGESPRDARCRGFADLQND